MRKFFKQLVFIALISLTGSLYAEGFNVTLKDVEMTDFIEQVGKITGKTFVVDQRVRGKITVISNQELPQSAVYELFLAVLQVYGYAAVPDDSGRVIKIIQNSVAKQHAIPLGREGKRGQELITRVIPIQNTPASELVSVLRPMVPSYGHLASANSANALIVIDHASNIRVLESIISVLDKQKSQDVEVVTLQYAWAPDVVEKVNAFIPNFFGAGAPKKGASSGGVVNVVADERTNRIFIFGEGSARTKIRQMIEQFDQPGQETESAQVVKLRYAKAKEMADLLTKAMSKGTTKKGGKTNAPVGTELSIQADEATNSLVVRASTRDMREIRSLIEQLDLRRAQILIEAAILEVSADDAKELGSQLAYGNVDVGLLGINFSNVGGNAITDIAAAAVDKIPLLGDGVTFGAGNYNEGKERGLLGIVQAISSVAKTNLLSTPSLMTLDNQEATIVVGENVPFISRTTQQSGGTNNPFVTNVERQDVGITLKVLPTITDENTVQLQVMQEASEVQNSAANSGGAVDVVTSKREIETTILVDNKQTVMLGGLISDRHSIVIKKVPILGDIPFLGALFRAKSNSREKSNLIVFLKPSIIRDGEVAADITNSRYQRLRALQLLVDDNGDISQYINTSLPGQVDDIYFGLETTGANNRTIQEVVKPATVQLPEVVTPPQPIEPEVVVPQTNPQSNIIDLMEYEAPQVQATPAQPSYVEPVVVETYTPITQYETSSPAPIVEAPQIIQQSYIVYPETVAPMVKVMEPIVEGDDDIVIYVNDKKINLDDYVNGEMSEQFQNMNSDQ